MQIAILFRHFVIACAECGGRITKPEDSDWDHCIEHADGGEHSIENLRPIHNRKSDDCHKFKSARNEARRHHIDRLQKAHNPASLPTAINPGEKCHRCGEYMDGCTCPPREPRKAAFGKRPMVRA